ncbi:autotransporter-associated beta strand repeat-containing protein [Luteolibacter flavescens]|uniref:Autotransporter-associated beta strand repeat-containing protein n=1 Tax=Luteolibacter flavescens TaxID=1859460 RepID=A0ABT3FUN9_9BACT|nr:autotransporter-associated beta strand repeat-containing protein [Luteolibacter flavescens]MCW1887009.1 autotransporter-associated beta strand repeat-containing protein [Luteolibacter flavescens]
MKKNHSILRSSILLLAASLPAVVQADYFWDGTDLTADADGGAGTWDATTANWDDAVTAGNPVPWLNTQNAVFGGTAGNVSIAAGGITAANVSFNTTGYSVQGGTLAVGTGSITTAPGVDATVSSVITGSSGLTKAGTGTLTLTGLSTYTGNTTILAGTLKSVPAYPTYRYYRFEVLTKTTPSDGYNQIGELHYYKNGVRTAAIAGSQTGSGTGEQLWSNANDNKGANINDGFTKYGVGTLPYFLRFDFGTPTAFDGYNWSSGNDSTPARNPRRWKLSASNDDLNYTVIDDRSTADQAGPGTTYSWSGYLATYGVNNNSANTGFSNAYPLGQAIPVTSSLAIATGASFDMNGHPFITAGLADSGGAGGSVINSVATPVTLKVGSAGNSSFSGTISDGVGAVTVAKVGGGTQTLTGTTSNTYTGLTILGGSGKLLLAKTGGAIAIPGNVSLSSSNFGGNAAGIVLGENEQIANSAILTWTSQAYGDTSQADTFFRMNGKTETVGGLVSPNNGLAVIENRGRDDSGAYPNGVLIINVTGTNSYSYGGQIRNIDGGSNGGAIALTKTGTGTQILGGTMTGATGPAQVLGGTLRVNSSLASATVAVSGSGSILEGTGTVTGALTIDSGGVLSPGVAAAGTFIAGGAVTVGNGGMISLTGTATLNSSPVVGSGGVLSLAGTSTLGGSATIGNGGILRGVGTITGAVNAQAGSEVAPGGTSIATLNTNNSVTLAGNSTFQLNKTGATLTNDKLKGFTTITYGGTLTLSFTGDTLVLGDSFQLFEPGTSGSYAGGFTSITGLPTLPAGLNWETTSLNSTGRITVVNTASLPSFSPNGGSYVGAQSVTIASDPGSTIYYTIDGSDPVVDGPATLTGTSPVTGISIATDSVVTLKAFAAGSGLSNSAISTAVYRTATNPRWVVDADGAWSGSGNWYNGMIPSSIGAPVDFTLPQTANRVVSLDISRTVGSLTFGNTNPFTWTISNPASNTSVLTLAVPTGTPTINVQNVTSTIVSNLAGTQGLSKTGPGTLLLSGSSSYTGTTSVDGGVLAALNLAANGLNSSIGAGTTLALNGTTFRYTNAGSNGAFNRNITLGAGGGTIDTDTPTNFLFSNGVISGPGSLTKIGVRQLILNGNSTYDGDTFVNTAEVQFRTLTSFGSTVGKTVVAADARVSAGGAVIGTILENFELNGLGGGNGALQANDASTNITYGGNIVLATESGIGGGMPFAISGPISGGGGLVKVASNVVTLNGATNNTYTGVTTLGGNGKLLLAKTGGAIAISGNINMSSAANANPNNAGIVLAGDEQIANTSVITWTPTAFGGGVQQAGYLRLNGHTETVGGLVSAGNINEPAIENRGLGDGGAYNAGTLIINVAEAASYVYGGQIRNVDGGTGGGTIAITKTGLGTQTISGTHTYSGATTVNAGTLVVNSTLTASPVTVAAGGTLKGTGGTASTLTAAAGSTIAPGASVGTFSAGNTVLDGTYACEIDGATADRLTVTGSLDIAGATLNFDVLTAPTEDSYIIASYTTDLTGTFEVVDLPSGYEVVYDAELKQIRLDVAPVTGGSFASFAETYNLSGVPTDDEDGDGLQDAVEYVLGTDPTDPASANAPTASLVGGNLVFTFTRDDAALTPDISIAVEVSTTLATWPEVYEVGIDTAASDEGVVVTDGEGSDTITVTIPQGTDTAKFARLKVTVAVP